MEQDGKIVGRQALEPYPEPRKDDGTGCQTGRETKPRNQEIIIEQDSKKVGRQAPEP